MSVNTVRLKNGGLIGWSVLEVTAIPLSETLGENLNEVLDRRDSLFADLMRTIAGFGDQQNTFVELLCIGQPVQKQVYSAQPRLFVVFRRFSSTRADAENCLSSLMKNWLSALTAFGYSVKPADDKAFSSLISSIQSESILSVEKQPGTAMVPGQMMYIWHTSETRLKTPSNLSSVYEIISRSPGAAVSLQLTATRFTPAEHQFIDSVTYCLNLVNHQGRHCDGELCYHRLQQHKDDVCYLGSIVVFGRPEDASMLSSTIAGVLRGEEQQISIAEQNRSGQAAPLSAGFAAWPWNYLSAVLSSRNPEQNVPVQFRRLVHVFSAGEIRSFFHFPVDDGIVQGIPGNRTAIVRDTFEQNVINSDNINLGHLLSSGGTQANIGTDPGHFTQHALVVGMPGTGKTTFAMNLLFQFNKKGIPFLAIEPTKTEYRALIDIIPDLQVFTPGKNDLVPFIINPFLPPEGITLEVFKPSLVSAFKAAFSMPNPLDILFAKTIDVCYTEHGWRGYTKTGDPDAAVFGLQEFIRTFKTIIQASEYSREVKGNMESAGVFRLTDLIVRSGNIFDTEKSIPLEDLLKKPTVIELNAIGDLEQKALIIALLLISIVLYTKNNQAGDEKLKNILMIDEAHVLLGNAAKNSSDNTAAAGATTVQAIQAMIVENRSYGTGIIIADQSPEKVTHEVAGNTDIKIAFRLENSEDRLLIKRNTNMSDTDEANLAVLNKGEAYAYFRGLKKPVCIMTEDFKGKKKIRSVVSDDELRSKIHYWRDKQELLKPYHECSICEICKNCNFRLRDDAIFYAAKFFARDKSALKDKTSLLQHAVSLPKRIQSEADGNNDLNQLIYCTCIRYLRKSILDTSIVLSPDEIKKYLKHITNTGMNNKAT